MKRLLPLALVALLVLVPAGFVWAAKSAKPKKSAETKAAHRSAKQKAANEKLVQELLTIMEETDNKMTFAACAECLTQLKPAREVVVPAIIRKADKMGWLKVDAKGEGNDDVAMIGEVLLSFLPHKQNHQPAPNAYTIQTPGPAYFGPPPSAYSAPIYPNPQPPMYSAMPTSFPQPCPCPPPLPSPPASPSWEAATRHSVPATAATPCVVSGATTPTDKLTVELLKILEETESKVTFAVVVGTLAERDQNWDVIIPVIIRKADKMAWLKSTDKDFAEGFTDDLAELVREKAKQSVKVDPPSVPKACSIVINGVSCADAYQGDGAELSLRCVDSSFATGTTVGESISSVETLPMPRATEVIPMPHRKTERLPMPRAEEE